MKKIEISQGQRGLALRLAPILIAASLIGCFESKPTDVAGGGGVETTGGAIASLAGNVVGARVRMIPAGYNPLIADTAFPDSLETITHADGSFSFRGLPPGVYNLDVFQPGDGTRFFKAGISIVKGVSITRHADTLRAPCQVRLVLNSSGKGFLYQLGTTNKRKLEYAETETRVVLMDSFPAGTLPPILLSDSITNPSPLKVTDSLQGVPGALLDPSANAVWLHQGVWRMDTLPAGAGLSGDLGNYSMLLRFNRASFNFAEVLSQGTDLLFLDQAGKSLPFEIERWDAVAGKAEVWVGMQQVLGAAGDRTVSMYWGNTNAKLVGKSFAVFDTAFGFLTTWHLQEAGNTRKNGYSDATQTGLGGLGTIMAPDSPDSGLIAGAQFFDGDGSNIRMDNGPLGWTGAMMVSAWISPSFGSGDAKNHAILARWEEVDSAGFWLEYAPDIKGLRLGLGLKTAQKVSILDAPNMVFAPGEWHLVAAAYDGTTASIYWDGHLVAQSSPGPAAVADSFRDFLIGAKGDPNPNNAETEIFAGRIDEVRIYHTPRTSGWLNLDYLTQKPGAAFAQWERIR